MSLDALLLCVMSVAPTQVQQVSTLAPPMAEVRTTGTATRSLPPDLAIATFEVSGRGPTLSAAALAAGATSDAIRCAAVKAGVPDDSVMVRGSVALPWDQATQIRGGAPSLARPRALHDIRFHSEVLRQSQTVELG